MISACPRPADPTRPATAIHGMFLRLMEMMEVARQRRHLAALSDWQLKDIGLSRADVAEEIEKPFWQM